MLPLRKYIYNFGTDECFVLFPWFKIYILPSQPSLRKVEKFAPKEKHGNSLVRKCGQDKHITAAVLLMQALQIDHGYMVSSFILLVLCLPRKYTANLLYITIYYIGCVLQNNQYSSVGKTFTNLTKTSHATQNSQQHDVSQTIKGRFAGS